MSASKADRDRTPAAAPHRDRGGFTLPEIMVVMVILMLGIVPLALVQTQARHQVAEADLHTQALVLAQARLEQMKGAGLGNAAPDSGVVGRVRWRSQVQNVSFGLDRLTVTVTWFDGRSDRQLQCSDLISMR